MYSEYIFSHTYFAIFVDNLVASLLAGGTETGLKPKLELGNNINDVGDNKQDKQKPRKFSRNFNKLVFGR